MSMGRACIAIKIQSLIYEKVKVNTLDISSNGNADPNEALDDFIQHVVEEKKVEKTPRKDPKAEDSRPPGFEKGCLEQLQPPGFENMIKENKACYRLSSTSRVGGTLGYDVKGCIRSLRRLINCIDYIRRVILFGDLNEVSSESERFGFSFSYGDATIFNSFIYDIGLIDLPMGGRHFTWVNKVGSKMSKLDHFFISYMSSIPIQTQMSLRWIDYGQIIIPFFFIVKNDFGPTPFKFFSSWFDRIDFEDIVKEKWAAISDLKQSKSLHTKLNDLKSHLKLGMRKGDPLSPFVFIIFIEGLHMALNDGLAANMFHNVKVGSPGVSRIGNLSLTVLRLDRQVGNPTFSPLVATLLSSNMCSVALGSSEDSKKLPWVKWSNILASLDKRGLGVGSLIAFNMSLLLKKRWRLFHNPNALWVHVVKAIHGDEAGINIRGCHTNGV
nr:RNA-directed DNA polymerase, eukaryota, reverse transcriptase zinc-binding domain protein [Tanacetum cinerariifolium]